MAYYLVRATPKWEMLDELRSRLDSGEIVDMRPFGQALDKGLREAKLESESRAVWEEEDYCRPPLAMERAAVLDDYFENLTVTSVDAGEGWAQIDDLPSMWENQ